MVQDPSGNFVTEMDSTRRAFDLRSRPPVPHSSPANSGSVQLMSGLEGINIEIENTIYRSFDVGETPGFTWKRICATCHVFKLLNHPTPGHELENLLVLSREWMGCWGLLG